MNYLITYDLRTPGKNYDELIAALKAVGAIRIQYSAWMVEWSNTTPKVIADYCLKHMDANDSIFVTGVSVNFAYRSLLTKPLAA